MPKAHCSKQMMSPINLNSYKIIAMVVAVIFVFISLYVIYIPIHPGDKRVLDIIVPSGQGVYGIAKTLQDAGLIRSQNLFVLYIHLAGNDRNLKAGKYLMPGGLNIPQIVEMLSKGLAEPEDIVVTIPEGSNIWDIDSILSKQKMIVGGDFAGKFYRDEGSLFPDTYQSTNYELRITNYEFKNLAEELRNKMAANFKAKTNRLFNNLNSEKQRAAVIIASLLEKEAKTEEDMRLISGIIKKRLEKGMPLEVDASIIYGACLRKMNYELRITNYELQTKNCDVSLQSPAIEIKIDSPYNTYKRKGLPAGAISNPGLVALKAALEPQASDYLYYLSTRDGSQLIYAKTPAEQARNRKKYLGI